jgi:hypothetical protein
MVDQMTLPLDHRRALCLLLAFFNALWAGVPAARSGDDDVVPDQPVAGLEVRQPHMVDLGANFDSNLFEQRGNGWVIRGGGRVIIQGPVRVMGLNGLQVAAASDGQGTPSFGRARALGEKKLERIESACGLSAEQRRQLGMAIESDARRFAAEIDAVRSRYQGREVNMNEPAGQKEWHAFQQDVQRCRDRLRGLFGSGSFFAAVLGGTLDERQLACLEEEQSARRSFHWRAMVAEVLAKLDDTLALTQQQHAVIERLLLAHQPALRIDEAGQTRDDANLRRQLVLLVLSEVDAKALQAAVNDRQWRGLSTLTAQGRAMRSWIEQQGVLERPGQ